MGGDCTGDAVPCPGGFCIMNQHYRPRISIRKMDLNVPASLDRQKAVGLFPPTHS